MLSILINAYACAPNMGSEPGMAWNWIINLAVYCKVYIITEGEWEVEIKEELIKLPQRNNIHFYYNPVPEKIRKMCKNQGDWRFYYYYRKWQKKVLTIAQEILTDNHIDIIHQLNMIGFREPGYLWKIPNIPYVWGPIGGMENIPVSYLENERKGKMLIIKIKNIINTFQAHYSKRVSIAINRADALVAAVKGVKDVIEVYYHKKTILINETGCYIRDESLSKVIVEKMTFDIIWVGKFDFRKQLGLALQTIAKLKNLNGLKFHIVGSGSKTDIFYYNLMADKLGIHDLCIWHGLIPNNKVQRLMRESDLLFFTSILEGTPHVVLEAIGNNLPVLCFNSCGQSTSVNESVGIKIEITSSSQSIDEFTEKVRYLYYNREILNKMSKACKQRQKELSWDSKAREMIDIYVKISKIDF
jgi:glycosyltransferase involved in cell wall biosynthesis